MHIEKIKEGQKLTFKIDGHIDTQTAPEFEKEVNDELPGVNEFYLDLALVEYISSAGLRVILSASKIMSKQGSMEIINTPKNIKELFDLTGFSEVLNIE